MLRPFSETISFGSRATRPGMVVSPTQKEISTIRRMKPPVSPKILRRKLLSKSIQNALGILETVKAKGLTFVYPATTEQVFITKELFRKSQKRIVENIKHINPEDLKSVKNLLKTQYPVQKMTIATAKPLAEKAAKKALEKEGVKITAGILAKYTKKFIPIIRIVGYITFAAWLAKYWRKDKKFSEASQGEYYHPSIGWY